MAHYSSQFYLLWRWG